MNHIESQLKNHSIISTVYLLLYVFTNIKPNMASYLCIFVSYLIYFENVHD